MKYNFFDIMNELNQFVSVSGHEKSLLDFVKDNIKQYCDNVYYDIMGNLISQIGKDKGEKVMFSAHSDTIGLICYGYTEKGFLKVSNVGWIDTRSAIGTRVRFENGVDGILSFEEETKDAVKNLRYCYVDIGAKDAEEAKKMVSVGTVCSFVGEVYYLGKDKQFMASPFLDDRIAVASQILAIKKLHDENIKLKNEVYFVFSVQEEVGIRGAGPATFGINPKYGIAIDVTGVSDTPESGYLTMKLGDGACIKYMDRSVICSKPMVDFLTNVANRSKIKNQPEILTYGGTDAGEIHVSRSGVCTGAISIPTRYVHSPNEVAATEDCLAVVDLIVASIKKGFNF